AQREAVKIFSIRPLPGYGGDLLVQPGCPAPLRLRMESPCLRGVLHRTRQTVAAVCRRSPAECPAVTGGETRRASRRTLRRNRPGRVPQSGAQSTKASCLPEGEKMAPLCAEFGISRRTGYKTFDRYKN